MPAAWGAQEFEARLRAVGASRYHDKHPFHVRLHEGRLSPDELRTWIRNRFYYQAALPVKDALILSKLPTREDRRRWMQRIIDQDGGPEDEGGIEAWLRLGEGAGVSRDEMLDDDDLLPGVRFAVDGYVNFCRLHSWLEAVASSLTELFAPSLVRLRIGIIETRYPWVKPEALEYFRRRLRQAPRDAEHALGLVLMHATTPESRDLAVAALRFKCDVLWSMLDAIALACSQRVPA